MREKWKLKNNGDGDCLYEFQFKKWTKVRGCVDGCECVKKPDGVPIDFPNLIEIVRKPCKGPNTSSDEYGIDAYGFLRPRSTGQLHCIRVKTKAGWVYYFYKGVSRVEPDESGFPAFEGYMECTDSKGRIIANGILADFWQYSRLKWCMHIFDTQLGFTSDFLAAQRKGFITF